MFVIILCLFVLILPDSETNGETRKRESAHYGPFVGKVNDDFIHDDMHYEEALCLTSLRCKCDSHCHVFNDCCIDNIREPPEKDDLVWDLKRSLSCFGENPWEFGKTCYVVSKCASTWTSENVKRKCENPNTLNIEEITPVYDGTLHYRNMFCLKCQGIQKSYERWNAYIDVQSCNVLKHLDTSQVETLKQFLDKLLLDPDCYFSFSPDETWTYRRCYPGEISDCNGTVDKIDAAYEFLRDYLNHICKRFQAAWFFLGKYYNNVECIICRYGFNFMELLKHVDPRPMHECLALHGKGYENNTQCPRDLRSTPVFLSMPSMDDKSTENKNCPLGQFYDNGHCLYVFAESKDVKFATMEVMCAFNDSNHTPLTNGLQNLTTEGIIQQTYVRFQPMVDDVLHKVFLLYKPATFDQGDHNATSVIQYVKNMLQVIGCTLYSHNGY